MHFATVRASPAVNEWTHRIPFLAITVPDRLRNTKIRSKCPRGSEPLLIYPHVLEFGISDKAASRALGRERGARDKTSQSATHARRQEKSLENSFSDIKDTLLFLGPQEER